MKRQIEKSRPWKKILIGTIAALIALYLVLLIPEKDYQVPTDTDTRPFIWNRDELWASLEALFNDARLAGCDRLELSIDSGIDDLNRILKSAEHTTLPPIAEIFDTLESSLFILAARIAACPARMPEFIDLYSAMRTAIKNQSRDWDMNLSETRHRIYRLLYGGRAAVDEIMLQSAVDSIPSLVMSDDEPSIMPPANLLGITIHSGDILVSRGGAPTSALIARGNDYPGNFSHVALAYVDSNSCEMSIIESHIECGVSISTPDQYLHDTKLRVLVLRLRSDLPLIIDDPRLPHKAALAVLTEAQNRHIAYDFEMDFDNHDQLFCSEVASAPYGDEGIGLWMGVSHISSMTLRRWLAALGVRHFKTQEPSDLEYDPQLAIVAEWRNRELLYKDHLDNAVLDAMLEGADSTKTLDYNRYMLPMARLIKAYSVVKNTFGAVGPIPEGMSATAALRVDRFSQKHEAIKGRLIALADDFRKKRGYTPTYWVLVELAEQAKSELESTDD